MTIREWRTLDTDIVFRAGDYFQVRCERVELPDGTQIDYYTTVRRDVALVAALTERDELVLVRQFKQGARAITLELPGGEFDHSGEDPLDAATRELAEETGYACRELRLVGLQFDDASRNNNRVHVYLGTGAYPLGEQNLDHNERASGIEVQLYPLAEAPALLADGLIKAQSSVAGLYRILHELPIKAGAVSGAPGHLLPGG
ncbi:MAG: NUDIX hydrolase [Mycobacteriales bacterium]